MLLLLLLLWPVPVQSDDVQGAFCQTSLNDNNNNLLITCFLSGSTSTFKSCNIYWNKKNDVVPLPRTVDINIPATSVKCELTAKVAQFGVGSHEFYGIFVSESGSMIRSESVTITFSLPEVSLNSDCYVPWGRLDNCLVGAVGYCTCSLKTPGFPPAHIWWVKSEDSYASQELSDTSSKLLVTSPAPYSRVKNETFTCVWESALDKKSTESFKVLYPIGPTSMTFRTLEVRDRIDLCPGTANSLNVVCEVPEDAVFPYPWFHFSVNGTIPAYNWNAGTLEDGVYTFSRTLTIDRGGNFSLYCQPANSCNRESLRKTLNFQIREPPSNAPVITINNISYNTAYNTTYNASVAIGVTIKEGATTTVSCHVSGGVPPVQNVTLTCGAQHVTTTGTSAELPTFAATVATDGQLCSCKASHVTGCYDKQTSVRITISNALIHLKKSQQNM